MPISVWLRRLSRAQLPDVATGPLNKITQKPLLEAAQVREIQGGVKLTYGVRFSEQDVLRDTMASLSWKLADATTLQLHGARKALLRHQSVCYA